jgi:hypothetical protein
MVVTELRYNNQAFLGAMNARTTLDVSGVEMRNGREIGYAAIQLHGTRIKGVISRGHWLDIPRHAIRPGGRVKRLLNLSTGHAVHSQFRFLDWFH